MNKSFSIFKKSASLDARKARAGYVFILPFLLGIVLIYLPILLDSIWFSFNKLTFEIVDGEPVQVLTRDLSITNTRSLNPPTS